MGRTAQDLSLAQAERAVGYSASTMSRIETGRQRLTDVTLLRRSADTFSIPPQLFGLAPAESSSTGAAATPPGAAAATVSGNTAREGGDDPVRRHQLLNGLVSVTGAEVLRSPDQASTAPTGSLNRLLTASAGTTVQPVSAQPVQSSLAAAHFLF